MVDMTAWVKSIGVSILLIVIITIIIGKFKGIEGIGVGNVSDGLTTVNDTLITGQTLITGVLDYIEIGLLVLVGAFFFKKLTGKGSIGS